MTERVTRRDVLTSASSLAAVAAGAGLFPAPAVLADAKPGRKLNVAAIGCGGRGLYMNALGPELNLVALAEADAGNLTRALKRLEGGAEKAGVKDFDPARLKTFSDYRAMYDKIPKEIDLVLIATPDHQHACPSMMAIKLGKHVYCEKPLVHHISEARALAEAARGAKVATQMGNQGSGTGGHQTVAEWLAAGAVGKLREVHAWHIFASRFGGSMPKPEPQPVPKGLDWDAWLGPAQRATVQFRLPAMAWLVRLRYRLPGRLGHPRDGRRVLRPEVGLSPACRVAGCRGRQRRPLSPGGAPFVTTSPSGTNCRRLASSGTRGASRIPTAATKAPMGNRRRLVRTFRRYSHRSNDWTRNSPSVGATRQPCSWARRALSAVARMAVARSFCLPRAAKSSRRRRPRCHGRPAGSWAISSARARRMADQLSPASPHLPVPSWRCCLSGISPCVPG